MKEEKQKVTVSAKDLKPYIDKVSKLKQSALSITESLYRQLGGCFELYAKVRDDNKEVQQAFKDKLNVLAIKDGLSQSNNLQTAIVRYVFGKLSRDVVSKYATTISVMYKKELATDAKTFTQFLLDNGGYTNINDNNVADSDKLKAKLDFVTTHMADKNETLVDNKTISFNDKWIVCYGKKTPNGMDVRYVMSEEKANAFIATNVYPSLSKMIKEREVTWRKQKAEAKKNQNEYKKQLNSLSAADIEKNADAFNRVFETLDKSGVVNKNLTVYQIKKAVSEKLAVA